MTFTVACKCGAKNREILLTSVACLLTSHLIKQLMSALKLYTTVTHSDLTPPNFFKNAFYQLIYSATKSIEFSFDNIMYLQIDGFAMGSPLDSSLANVFVGSYKQLHFEECLGFCKQI